MAPGGGCFGSKGTDSISSEGQLARALVTRAASSIEWDVWPPDIPFVMARRSRLFPSPASWYHIEQGWMAYIWPDAAAEGLENP
jgi:hypothetical protein